MVRIYSEQNKNTFQKLLGDVNWDIEQEHKNVNEAMMTFNPQGVTSIDWDTGCAIF